MKKSNLTLIVGCGRMGSSLAGKLSDENIDVIVLDRKQDSFKRLSSSFGGMTVVGDGCDIDSLKEANIVQASVFVAVTNFENNNIMIGQLAKTLFNVENVIVRIDDINKKYLCDEFGIKAICPSEITSSSLFEALRENR